MEAISFKSSHWVKQKVNVPHQVWHSQTGDGLGLYHFNIPPNIPVPLEAIDKLRQFYRLQAAEGHSGVIQLDVIEIDGVPVIKSIIKVPQSPSGMTYLGSYTFPRRDFSYVLKIQCQEYGTTGLREAVILNRKMADGQVAISDEGTITGWMADPYDPNFKGRILRNLAEAEQYDSEFPAHPLSRLRFYLNDLQPTIRVSSSVKKSAPF